MENVSQVLLVEDNEDDFELTCEAFRRSDHAVDLHHVKNGVQCMEFLRKNGAFSDARTPHLILLDLNMPVMDGREVLSAIGSDEKLKHLPVVVLTTSNSNVDSLISYKLGCNAYIVKPFDIHDFRRVVDNICEFWFKTATLPVR